MIIVAIVFVGVLALIVGAYWGFVVFPEGRHQSALRRRLVREERVQSAPQLLKQPEVLSGIGSLNAILNKFGGLTSPLKHTLEEAGLKQLTVGTFVLASMALFFLVTVVVNWYFGIWWVALAAGAVGAASPSLVVNQIRTARVR